MEVDRQAVLRRVRIPAFGLLSVAAGDALFAVAWGVLALAGAASDPLVGVCFALFFLLCALVVATGGLNLLRLDAYGLVKTGSITAMVPFLSPLAILGVVFGVWALVVSSGPDVYPAFRRKPKL